MYRQTVLVIWPTFADCVVASDLGQVCFELKNEAETTDTRTPEQHAIIEFLLEQLTDNSDDAILVADAIYHAAYRWKDPELWNRAVNRCSRAAGIMALDVEGACTAIKAFGLDTIKSRRVYYVYFTTKYQLIMSVVSKSCFSTSCETINYLPG